MTEAEVWRQAYNAALTGSCLPLSDEGFEVIANECVTHADRAVERYRSRFGTDEQPAGKAFTQKDVERIVKERLSRTNTEAELEREWLNWLVSSADFGPADGNVRLILEQRYTEETGNEVPSDWSWNTEENDD